MRRPLPAILMVLLLAQSPLNIACADEPARRVDVCVYGATASGVIAAVAARQEGCTVVLVEPSRWAGGILGAGIKPMQDCAEPKAVGGLTAKCVFAMGKQPDVIRRDFAAWLQREQIPVIFEHRVQRVEKSGSTIARITLELAPPDEQAVPAPMAVKKDAATIEAKVFIDASYEGDLMALAGVHYAVGRESAGDYNEKLAGVGPPTNWTPIDPYVTPGDPKSGLLPLLDEDHGRSRGAADDRVRVRTQRQSVARHRLRHPDGGGSSNTGRNA